ncbi:hypothetical protein OG241_43835 [Streptomyces sp. NBC_01390]
MAEAEPRAQLVDYAGIGLGREGGRVEIEEILEHQYLAVPVC